MFPQALPVAVNVSGAAPLQDMNDRADQRQQGDTQQVGEAASASVQPVPGRVNVLKWPLIVGFVALFGLGGFLLARKTVMVAAGAGAVDEDAPSPKPKKSMLAAAPIATPAQRPSPRTGPRALPMWTPQWARLSMR